VVSRNTTLVFSLGLHIGPACEAGLSAGMRRERVPPRMSKKERNRWKCNCSCVLSRLRYKSSKFYKNFISPKWNCAKNSDVFLWTQCIYVCLIVTLFISKMMWNFRNRWHWHWNRTTEFWIKSGCEVRLKYSVSLGNT